MTAGLEAERSPRGDEVRPKADETLERTRIAERYATIRTLIKGATVVGALYIGKDLVIALAGRETALSVTLGFLGD